MYDCDVPSTILEMLFDFETKNRQIIFCFTVQQVQIRVGNLKNQKKKYDKKDYKPRIVVNNVSE